jgi:hypothetical protein
MTNEARTIIFLDIDSTLTSGFNHIPQSTRQCAVTVDFIIAYEIN